MRSRTAALLAAMALLPVGAASAQSAQEQGAWLAGLEYRALSFRRLLGAGQVRQVALPFGAELALGRLSIEAGTSWASTTLTRRDGTDHNVSNLTDTQVRASYVFGRDALVATIVANLPTGPDHASVQDYTVIGAVSPAFLAFPVPVYASGLSMVGGLATAFRLGDWSIGLAGSLKVSDGFTPYRDTVGVITYRPGLESRLRAGADGLVGSSQLTVGLTWSTFGTDQFGSGGTRSGEYRPGSRLIAEGSLLAPIGSSALAFSLWSFHRSAGSRESGSVANQEDLAGGSVAVLIPIGRSLSFEPRVEGRLAYPESGSGQWVGVGTGTSIAISDGLSVQSTIRYDHGSITGPAEERRPLRGWAGLAFVRMNY